jgi:methionine-gamma-lyase
LRAHNEGEAGGYLYSRYANPSVEGAEEKLAVREGAEACLLYSSGQAATSGLLLGLAASGR